MSDLDLTLPTFLVRSKLMENVAMAKPRPMKDITPEEPAHAVLGASSNHIWLNCQGQPNLVRKLGLTSPPNEYSAQGSAAHEIAAWVLKGERELWEFAGETWNHDGFSGEVDDEMIAGIQLYVDTLAADGPAEEILIETKVSLKEFHPDLWGTLDAAKVQSNLLRVYDFKYGVNHVEAEDNTQLMQYGASLVNEIHEKFPTIEWVEFVIVQPRGFASAGPVRRWKIAVDALGEWMGATLIPGAKATDKPDAPLSFGSWCRWCPANSAKTCPKIKDRVGGIMNAAEKAPTTEADAQALDDWEIAEQLDLKNAVMKHFALLEAEAFTRMMNGGHVPGQKLVMSITRRVWKDGAEEKVRAALGAAALTEPTLKSPAQVEKLGKEGKALSAEWAFKPEGILTMASVDDRRPAVTPRDVGSVLNSV